MEGCDDNIREKQNKIFYLTFNKGHFTTCCWHSSSICPWESWSRERPVFSAGHWEANGWWLLEKRNMKTPSYSHCHIYRNSTYFEKSKRKLKCVLDKVQTG